MPLGGTEGLRTTLILNIVLMRLSINRKLWVL